MGFVPEVSSADVERVVRREFPEEVVDRVLALLESYGPQKWHREKTRVRAERPPSPGGGS